uniref:Fibroblast growth factor n=1 Tax=Gallus gallus TaxID=9031 RepID=A0A8V0XJ05_CHICK
MSFTLTPDGHVTHSSLQHIGCSFFSCCNSLAKVFFLQVPQEGEKLFLCRSLFCGWLCCNALAFRHGNTVLLKIPESESTALHRKIWDCFCVLSRSSFVCNEWPSRTGVKLQLQAEERGVVSIKGVSANRFLAMKEDGRLLALKCATEECFFFERLESNNYNTYRSRKYSDWYVALKRTGQYKPGPKTGPGQKAILFLPMSAKS